MPQTDPDEKRDASKECKRSLQTAGPCICAVLSVHRSRPQKQSIAEHK